MGQDLTAVDAVVLEEMLRTRRSKWTFRIVLQLRRETKRFSELQREIGQVSQKSLASGLKILERDGIISRKSYAVIPPRVDYRLTTLGLELLLAFEAFEQFAVRNWQDVLESRRIYDNRSLDGVISLDLDHSL